MLTVLISDRAPIRSAVEAVLSREVSCELRVHDQFDGEPSADLVRADIIIIDAQLESLRMSRGLEVAAQLSEMSTVRGTLAMIGRESFDGLRAAHRIGVSEYLRVDRLVPELSELVGRRRTHRRVGEQTGRFLLEGVFEGMIGASPKLRELQRRVCKVARSPRPVLVRGPTGSGKELVARGLHARSQRNEEPFIDLNCGAIPEHLVEAFLFGHRRGAFTGAEKTQAGYLEAVGRGTLFLDEVAELPHALQSKLLRVLETGEYRMVGCTELRRFEGRVVAATHADLEGMVRKRTFREDLFHRIAVFELRVPGLDERKEDIPPLVRHFVESCGYELHFRADAMEAMAAATWRGNVRQLRNVVDRIAMWSDNHILEYGDVAPFLPDTPVVIDDSLSHFASHVLRSEVADKITAVQDLLIAESMRVAGGNKSAAARVLGVHRKVLERRLQKTESKTWE